MFLVERVKGTERGWIEEKWMRFWKQSMDYEGHLDKYHQPCFIDGNWGLETMLVELLQGCRRRHTRSNFSSWFCLRDPKECGAAWRGDPALPRLSGVALEQSFSLTEDTPWFQRLAFFYLNFHWPHPLVKMFLTARNRKGLTCLSERDI